jgi:hypothetical protein
VRSPPTILERSASSPDTGNASIVWEWADAPAEFRAYSGHGGDEDWVALCPTGEEPIWAWGIGASSYILPDGRLLLIKAHC